MTKVCVTAEVDNPNLKRFNPSTNLCIGTEKEVTEFISELMFKTYTKTDDMKITILMNSGSSDDQA